MEERTKSKIQRANVEKEVKITKHAHCTALHWYSTTDWHSDSIRFLWFYFLFWTVRWKWNRKFTQRKYSWRVRLFAIESQHHSNIKFCFDFNANISFNNFRIHSALLAIGIFSLYLRSKNEKFTTERAMKFL